MIKKNFFRRRQTSSNKEIQQECKTFLWPIPGPDVINAYKGSISTLRWNDALWLDETSHVTWNIQSVTFISALCAIAIKNFWWDIPGLFKLNDTILQQINVKQ